MPSRGRDFCGDGWEAEDRVCFVGGKGRGKFLGGKEQGGDVTDAKPGDPVKSRLTLQSTEYEVRSRTMVMFVPYPHLIHPPNVVGRDEQLPTFTAKGIPAV